MEPLTDPLSKADVERLNTETDTLRQVIRRMGRAVLGTPTVDYTDPAAAVDIALRTKRYFADPTEADAHLKDTSYLRGWLMIEQRAAADPDLISDLYACKQPVDNLDLIRSLTKEGHLDQVEDPIPSRFPILPPTERPWHFLTMRVQAHGHALRPQ